LSDVRKWLEGIGLAQYADAFEANEIGMNLLRQVDDQMLKDIGVSIGGHRLRIRGAIAKLTASPTVDAGERSAPAKGEPQATSAERRQLTVMFADLVGSTALSARLDPEDMREIIGAYHLCCAEQITKAGGFVAKYMGDGVLAYFGYPQAHEDDAERAVRSGLSLIEAMPQLDTEHDVVLQVRVGIATGVVVVGDLIGEGVAQEQGVVGETPNLAARLQALAEPGQVVISQSTRRITGGTFEYRDLGYVALKSFADLVHASQVTGASAAEGRFYAQHQSELTPLVGRGKELELLQRSWRDACEGEGRVVLVSGEPGIGKSRLTDAFQGLLAGESHHRVRYFCSPDHTTSALYPVIRQLERAAGFERRDPPLEKLAKLEGMLNRASELAHEEIALLADLLSLPTEGRYSLPKMSSRNLKEKTLAGLLRI
jgi:class 3 adenylate cyclase